MTASFQILLYTIHVNFPISLASAVETASLNNQGLYQDKILIFSIYPLHLVSLHKLTNKQVMQ
jgi:hypothetical protein